MVELGASLDGRAFAWHARGRVFKPCMGEVFVFLISKRTFIFKAGIFLLCKLVSGSDSAQKEEDVSKIKNKYNSTDSYRTGMQLVKMISFNYQTISTTNSLVSMIFLKKS